VTGVAGASGAAGAGAAGAGVAGVAGAIPPSLFCKSSDIKNRGKKYVP